MVGRRWLEAERSGCRYSRMARSSLHSAITVFGILPLIRVCSCCCWVHPDNFRTNLRHAAPAAVRHLPGCTKNPNSRKTGSGVCLVSTLAVALIHTTTTQLRRGLSARTVNTLWGIDTTQTDRPRRAVSDPFPIRDFVDFNSAIPSPWLPARPRAALSGRLCHGRRYGMRADPRLLERALRL